MNSVFIKLTLDQQNLIFTLEVSHVSQQNIVQHSKVPLAHMTSFLYTQPLHGSFYVSTTLLNYVEHSLFLYFHSVTAQVVTLHSVESPVLLLIHAAAGSLYQNQS